MFHPIDTGPFKFVVSRPTDSIKAHPHPDIRTGARLSDGIEYTIFGGTSAAFDPNRTFGRAYEIETPPYQNRQSCDFTQAAARYAEAGLSCEVENLECDLGS